MSVLGRVEPGEAAADWAPDVEGLGADVHRELDAQRQRCPVPHAVGPQGVAYHAVLRHADVVKVTGDPRTFSSEVGRLDASERRVPLEVDPPVHTAVRRALQPYFTRARLDAMRPRIEEYARTMLGAHVQQGTADFIDFAAPYPARVLCLLMNMPDDDWEQVREWSLASVSTADVTDAERAAAREGLRTYALGMVAERRARPQSPAEDMTTGLLAAVVDGEPMGDEMIADALQLMLVAGHLTTTLSLGIIARHLARHPDLQDRLRAEPELIGAAVEEILRVESAVVANSNPRTVTQPVEVGGHQLLPGDRVLPVWGAANRDEERFPDPATVDLERGRGANVTFGRGIHLCIGAPVARLEMEVAVATLLELTTSFEVAGPVKDRTTWRQQGPTELVLAYRLAGTSP